MVRMPSMLAGLEDRRSVARPTCRVGFNPSVMQAKRGWVYILGGDPYKYQVKVGQTEAL